MIQPILNKLKHFAISYKKYFIALVGLLLLVSILKLYTYSITNPITDDAYEEYFRDNYKILSIRIPKNLNFAGEKVPTTDFTIREAIERELIVNTYWQSQTLLLHKRANRWFPIIEPILKKNNIPDDFKYVALIESQLTNAVSPQGAAGFWQLIESTATTYGLEISEDVDERYNVVKATEAACKYFNESYKQFNNWTLVAASYNRGMGGIQTQLEKQKVDNYFDLMLNDETSRYVYRLLAIKEVISRPRVYGYVLRKKDLYPPITTKKLTIDSTIHSLTDFAIKQGINYKILKTFNPWLRTNTLNNLDKKKYIIEIPKGSVNIYDMDGNYEGSNLLNKKDSATLLIPEVMHDSLKNKQHN